MVSAYPEGNDLIIEIADNGPGIDYMILQNLKERLMVITKQPDHGVNTHGSLGLTNVHRRLVLYYGKDYGINIHSFPNKGTVVSVRVPFIRKDNIS